MKNIALFIACLLTFFTAQAQNSDEIIQQVIEKTKEYKGISLDFDYTMLNAEMDINETNKGSLLFEGDKHALDLSQLGLKIYCDGTNTYTYNVEAEELTINEIEEDDQAMNPTNLLTMYKQGFASKYIGTKTINGKSCYQIELTPDGTEFEFDKVELFIDKAKLFLTQAKMHTPNGTSYTLKVHNLKTNVAIQDSQFRFDTAANPQVEVLDLR